jgi:signal transduction histidine kinase
MRRILRPSAASRIAIWTTLAFALGTALAFSILYFFVSRSIRERSDAWISGEAEVLARVAMDTPQDNVYKRVLGETAELAMHELPDQRSASGQPLNSVFFLEKYPDQNQASLWVGPGTADVFLAAIRAQKFVTGTPRTLSVDNWPTAFRVVEQSVGESGQLVYLGLSDRGAMYMLHDLARVFLLLWGGTALLGFFISYLSARRTLVRVESITETVAGIGTEELSKRLPEPSRSDEISRLGKTFNRMLDRIQASVNQLRSVTDEVAHDMKGPVTSIRGTLESALCKEPNANWRDDVGEAIEGLDRLLHLLNTTLDLAEAQAGALRLERNAIDISQVLRQLADVYQPAMAERNHELGVEIEPGIIAHADLSLMSRAIGNLLENELAHLPSGCRITIRLALHGRSTGGSAGGFAELVVEDNGPGFAPEIAGREFERFVKGKGSPGHGLGLAFVAAVMQAHGGQASVAERPGGGAMVKLLFPATAMQAA